MRIRSAASRAVSDTSDQWLRRNNGQPADGRLGPHQTAARPAERSRHAGHRSPGVRRQTTGFPVQAADHARTAVTWLLVPGYHPGWFQRLAGSGADAIVIDLDGPATPADKATARRAAIRYLSAGQPAYVQVNRPVTVALAGDLAALAEAGPALRGVILPQAEHPEQFRLLDDLLPPGAIAVALIQSPRGLLAAHEIAAAPRVTRLGFGSTSFLAGTGIEDQQSGLLVARSLLVFASRAQELAGPIDGTPMAANDLARVTMEAEASRRLGFTGKFCASARQVFPVAFGFSSASR